jgi:DNA helicase-2/ATP-dependent DNA helicase PcrA
MNPIPQPKFELDADRENILKADSHVLVTGGPGSGKTTIALLKAEKKINDGLAVGQSVLFLSFSRSAVGRILEASKIQLPNELQNRLAIQTFHSFFWEILRAYGYLLGAPKYLRLLLPQDERALRNGVTAEDAAWRIESERLFQQSGSVCFDLFAPKVHELFERSERLQALFAGRHPLIIVDEAQDTAEDQWHSVRLLASKAQLICLADMEQQIYDFRPGVSSERLTQIVQTLKPLRIDLEAANHRSPGSEIVKFGNDILLAKPRGSRYKGVSRINFRPDRARRDSAIRSSIGIISDKVRKSLGAPPQSIGVFATWGRGVNIITNALTGDGVTNRIPHRVLIDDAQVLLASRLIAFLLEPRKRAESELTDLAEGLELAAAIFRANDSATSLSQAKRLGDQAAQAKAGKLPKARSAAKSLLQTLEKLRAHRFSGDPRRDWLDVRKQLSDSGASVCADIGSLAEQLVAFQRGQSIATGLADTWQSLGNYARAREVLDAALAQDQLLSGGNDLYGIHVMTMHKSKAKEFDAVVILGDANSCPFVYCKEKAPFPRSRKLLRVGITRAKYHVLLLTDLFNPSPLLQGHTL